MEFLSALRSPVDTLKPSLFELLSEQQLASLLPPSLRYILAVATHRRPRYLLRILNNFDEVYALLGLIVERYYLATFGGSFTENFYGLKRERVLRVKGGEIRRTQLTVPDEVRQRLKLSDPDIWKNLAVLVGIPYLKRKLDESYDVHIAPSASLMMSRSLGGPQYLDHDALPANPSMKQRLLWYYKWFLRNVYPSVNAAYYFSILAFSLGYLFDTTKYHNPFLWLIGTRMRRMGDSDYRAIEAVFDSREKAAIAAGRPGQGMAGMLHPRNIYPRLLSGLRLFLPTSIFVLKFLEWWHVSDFSRQLTRKAAEALELPPPIVSGMGLAQVSRSEEEKGDVKANRSAKRTPPISSISYLPIFTVPPPPSTDLCPICLNPITTAAACQTGYVFDYKCIFQWIEGTHDRQISFMKGEEGNAWAEDEEEQKENEKGQPQSTIAKSREGSWESGKGRCAVTGRRVLGETSGLRRIIV